MLQLKPQQNSTEPPKQEDKPQKVRPGSFLGGGVVDIDANGFGSPFSSDFDFGLNSKPFGFGDLLSNFNRNQWWKG